MINELFLQALQAALENRSADWVEPLSDEQWHRLMTMAQTHQVLPMIYQAVSRCPAARSTQALSAYRGQIFQQVAIQAKKTMAFLPLLKKLSDAGVAPMVVKGIVCRSLYPNPDFRMSSDEDVLIPPEKMDLCHQILTEYGMLTSDDLADFEVSYTKPGTPLYLEMHKSLFSPDSEAYGDLNRFFLDCRSRSVTIRAEGFDVPTMCPTDHLFYLICHAFKHFLHSGFGIRQVCDIVLFANTHGSQIQWETVLENCRSIRADKFAAAMFRMGHEHLTFDPEKACWPECWREISVDYSAMLEELLQAGVFGNSDMNRKRSSNITLGAVTAQKQGRKKSGLLRSLFPPVSTLQGRYPWLKKFPFLLPIAWLLRILTYGKTHSGADAAESIKIGNARVALMRQYGILDE